MNSFAGGIIVQITHNVTLQWIECMVVKIVLPQNIIQLLDDHDAGLIGLLFKICYNLYHFLQFISN